MKQNNKVFAKRGGVLSAGMLSLLLALGGCGGGGGGGGAGLAPGGTIVVPSLEDAGSGDVDGFVAPYALDPATNDLESVPITVLGAGAVNGDLTITVDPIVLPDGKQEPGFVVTFDLASSGSTLTPSPLHGLCTDCLRSVDLLASGADPGDPLVTIIYLDPNSENFDLNFSTLGMWSKPTTVDDTPWDEVGGPFSAGVTADAAFLPATGTASYEGFFIGRYATSVDDTGVLAGTYFVGANAHADVNFGAGGGVTFSTSNTQISGGGLADPVVEPNLDITSAVLPINRNNASFEGTASTNGFDMNGNIAGGFYGPPGGAISAPQELGGAVAVGNAERSMVGSFGLKQQ